MAKKKTAAKKPAKKTAAKKTAAKKKARPMSLAFQARWYGQAKKGHKPTAAEKATDRLHHPGKFSSFARWQLAMEKAYGPHHVNWPQWGLALLVQHVGADLKRAGYG